MAGQMVLINVPARTLVLNAFPIRTMPVEVIGLPAWADSERYDVQARTRPGVSPDELQNMWRTLLARRMKLAAHYETRQRPGYNLVFARKDRSLGSELKPQPAECNASRQGPPAGLVGGSSREQPPSLDAEQYVLQSCGGRLTFRNTVYAGHIAFTEIVDLISRAIGRTVIDRTGLVGRFSLKLTFAAQPEITAEKDAPPSIFTAVEEQLGLKLESTTTDATVLIVDGIERPSEN